MKKFKIQKKPRKQKKVCRRLKENKNNKHNKILNKQNFRGKKDINYKHFKIEGN